VFSILFGWVGLETKMQASSTRRRDMAEENREGGIDASQLGGEDRPESGGENLPGAEGTAGADNRVTIPDPTGEEIANSIDVEP
jgi:hypothetical protein